MPERNPEHRASEFPRGRRVFLSAVCCFGAALEARCALHGQERRSASPASLITTEDRIALALVRFREGFHCSQAVLEAYAADSELDPELARRLAAPLAGGSTAGGECGVVGSAYLVLGLKYAELGPAHGDTAREERLWGRVRQFLAEFRKRNGAITCRDLLGVDAFTREGRGEALRRNLFVTRCPRFIRVGIEILDSLDGKAG